MDLPSSQNWARGVSTNGRSQVDFDWLAEGTYKIGGNDQLVEAVRNANTANHALEITLQSGLALGNYVARQATEKASKVIQGSETALNVIVFDRTGLKIGVSDA